MDSVSSRQFREFRDRGKSLALDIDRLLVNNVKILCVCRPA